MQRLAIGSLVLCSCAILKFEGHAKPTDDTVRLTPEQIEMAGRQDCGFEIFLFDGDPQGEVDRALAWLEANDIAVVKRNPFAGGTALQRRLYVTPKFDAGDIEWKASLMAHEVCGHYWDRHVDGDIEFEDNYAGEPMRWVYETRGYVYSVKQRKANGMSEPKLRTYIDGLVFGSEKEQSMRDEYWLWGIDPEQYETETQRILLEAAELEP